MHRLFQPSKNSRDCTQTVRSGCFFMAGARFGAYCNQKFRDRPGCIGCSSHLKTPGTVHRQYVQEAFLWLGQDLEYIVTRNFVIGRDA